MANLTITAGNVAPSAGADIVRGTAGATITAGLVCYLDTGDGRFKPASQNASAINARVVGIALNGASAGQPVALITAGNLVAGATVVVGEIYLLGASGAIMPVADLAQGNYVTVLGVGVSTSVIAVNIQVSNVQKP